MHCDGVCTVSGRQQATPHAAEYTSPKERKETLDHSPQKSELAWTQVTPSTMNEKRRRD